MPAQCHLCVSQMRWSSTLAMDTSWSSLPSHLAGYSNSVKERWAKGCQKFTKSINLGSCNDLWALVDDAWSNMIGRLGAGLLDQTRTLPLRSVAFWTQRPKSPFSARRCGESPEAWQPHWHGSTWEPMVTYNDKLGLNHWCNQWEKVSWWNIQGVWACCIQ